MYDARNVGAWQMQDSEAGAGCLTAELTEPRRYNEVPYSMLKTANACHPGHKHSRSITLEAGEIFVSFYWSFAITLCLRINVSVQHHRATKSSNDNVLCERVRKRIHT